MMLTGTHASEANLSVQKTVKRLQIQVGKEDISPSRINRDAVIDYYEQKIRKYKNQKKDKTME